MSTDHFDRLGTLASAILAENDSITQTGKIPDGELGARYLVVQHKNVRFQLYAHPSDPEVSLKTSYRPSAIYRAEMTEADVEDYARKISVNANDPEEVREEVIKHRVMTLNSEVDVDEAYEPIREAQSLSAPLVSPLPIDQRTDEYDGFVVTESLYPGEDRFSISRYKEKVTRALDTRLELARELHQNLGLDDLSEAPAEQEPDEPSTGTDHIGFA